MATAIITPPRERPEMHESHPLRALGWLIGSGSMATVSVRLRQFGWTPEAVAAVIGATTTLIMALVSLLKTTQPYFERIMDAREGRRRAKKDAHTPPPRRK